jgi:hypothetical protein
MFGLQVFECVVSAWPRMLAPGATEGDVMSAAAWELRRHRIRAARSCRSALADAGQRPAWPRQRPAGWPHRVRLLLLALVLPVSVVGLTLVAPGEEPAGAAGSGARGHGGHEGQGAPPRTVRVVVAQGDTVWSLAATHVPEGQDLQSYVAEIIVANEIDPAALQPGSVLDLPVPQDADKPRGGP